MQKLGGLKDLITGLHRKIKDLEEELARLRAQQTPGAESELIESLHRKVAELEEKLAQQPAPAEETAVPPLYMRRIQDLEMQLEAVNAQKELDAAQMQADKLEMQSLLVLYYDLVPHYNVQEPPQVSNAHEPPQVSNAHEPPQVSKLQCP